MSSRLEPFSFPRPSREYEDIYEAFVSIWDSKIMAYIAEQTNKYAESMRNHELVGGDSEWQNTNADELYVYFAVLFAVETTSVETCFSKDGRTFKSDYFSCTLTRERFKFLNSCLYFGEIDTILLNVEITPTQRKWLEIKAIVTHLNERFSELYKLHQNVVINENALESEFVRDSFAKENIKIYQVSDYWPDLTYVSYVWCLEIEVDNTFQESSASPEGPLSDNISCAVLRLVRSLESKGHTIWLQDLFNSPALARELKSLGFDCVGTFKTDKKFVPSQCNTLNLSNMIPGQFKSFTAHDIDLYTYLSTGDEEREIKHFISTFHNPYETKTYRDDIPEPSVVADCDRCQNGIYDQDQLLDGYLEDKESTVWYHILFKRLLNISIQNAYVLSKDQNIECNLHGKLGYLLMKHHGHVLAMPPVLVDDEFSE